MTSTKVRLLKHIFPVHWNPLFCSTFHFYEIGRCCGASSLERMHASTRRSLAPQHWHQQKRNHPKFIHNTCQQVRLRSQARLSWRVNVSPFALLPTGPQILQACHLLNHLSGKNKEVVSKGRCTFVPGLVAEHVCEEPECVETQCFLQTDMPLQVVTVNRYIEVPWHGGKRATAKAA